MPATEVRSTLYCLYLITILCTLIYGILGLLLASYLDQPISPFSDVFVPLQLILFWLVLLTELSYAKN